MEDIHYYEELNKINFDIEVLEHILSTYERHYDFNNKIDDHRIIDSI